MGIGLDAQATSQASLSNPGSVGPVVIGVVDVPNGDRYRGEDGDITLRTDGRAYNDGILYEAIFGADPGEFAQTLGEATQPLATVHGARTNGNYPDCH